MFDNHVDELDLCRCRSPRQEEITERLADGRAVEPDQRSHKAAEALAGLARPHNVAGLADSRVEQHLLQLIEIACSERFSLPQLVQHDVVLVRPEEVPRLQLEAGEVSFPSSQEIGAMQTVEQPAHLAGDVLGETEGTQIFGHPNGSVASSPAVDVLEQVTVYSAIVRGREAAGGKWLFGPYCDAKRLKSA